MLDIMYKYEYLDLSNAISYKLLLIPKINNRIKLRMYIMLGILKYQGGYILKYLLREHFTVYLLKQ